MQGWVTVWGWGGVDGILRREQGRPPGTQCSQETAVPVANPGSSPPINFLILECVASVLHRPLTRVCGDLLCVGTVQQEAQPASLRADTVLHCADEHPEVRRRGRSPPAAPQGWGCSSEGSACFSRQHSPQTGMAGACVLVPGESLSTWMSRGRHVTSLGLHVFACKQKCWLSELPFNIKVLEFPVRTQLVRHGR